MIAKSDIVILSTASILLLVAIIRLEGPPANGTTATYYTNGSTRTQRQVTRTQPGTSSQNTSLATTSVTDPAIATSGSQSAAQATSSTASVQDPAVPATTSSATGTSAIATTTEFKQPDVIREASFTTHIVKRGEYLSLIARRYETTVAELKKLNNIEGTTILVGQELVYPTN